MTRTVKKQAAPPFEILAGIHPVAEAIKAGRRRIDRIYAPRENAGKRVGKIVEKARRMNISVDWLSREQLRGIVKDPRHADIAAQTGPFPVTPFTALSVAPGEYGQVPLFLVLDSIVDPQNLGALVRTAVCTGVTGIIIPRDRSAGPTPAVSRASAGAMEHALICVVTNLVGTMKDLKKKRFWIIGLDQHGSEPIFQTDMTGPRALVVGGEDTGIRPLVRRHCDFLCRIPQSGPIGSLNASVAGAMALYEALRQRINAPAQKDREDHFQAY